MDMVIVEKLEGILLLNLCKAENSPLFIQPYLFYSFKRFIFYFLFYIHSFFSVKKLILANIIVLSIKMYLESGTQLFINCLDYSRKAKISV